MFKAIDSNQEQINSNSESLESVGPVAPEHEKTVSIGKSIKKLVRVESGSTSTFVELSLGESSTMRTWELYGLENGSLVDYSNNSEVFFSLVDSNSDGTLDRAEWNIINKVTDFYLISNIL